jgi:hypothetical protein
MRSVSTRFLSVAALLTLIVAIIVPNAYADEEDVSLNARIHPPGGAPSPRDEDSAGAILSPIGAPATVDDAAARIRPAIGAAPVDEGMSYFKFLLEWLARIRARIG